MAGASGLTLRALNTLSPPSFSFLIAPRPAPPRGPQVTAVLLMLCSCRPLAHPHRSFGRAFVLASALYACLHLLNITLQFQSYAPTNSAWRRTYPTAPKPALLDAVIVLGYMSAALCALEAGLVWAWRDTPNLYQVDASPAGA